MHYLYSQRRLSYTVYLEKSQKPASHLCRIRCNQGFLVRCKRCRNARKTHVRRTSGCQNSLPLPARGRVWLGAGSKPSKNHFDPFCRMVTSQFSSMVTLIFLEIVYGSVVMMFPQEFRCPTFGST